MKKQNTFKAALAVLAFGTVVASVPVMAADRTMARFDIPFEFVVGNDVLPAGHYEVSLVPDTRVMVRDISEAKSHVVGLSLDRQTRPYVHAEKSQLRFHRYGNTMYLTAVWGAGHLDARMVKPGKSMMEAQKTDVGAATESSSVTIDQQ